MIKIQKQIKKNVNFSSSIVSVRNGYLKYFKGEFMIKKFYVSAAFMAAIFMCAPVLFAQEKDPSTGISLPGFQLLLSGDIGYAKNSDMKKFSEVQGQDVADQYNDVALAHSIPGGFKVDKTTSASTTYGVDLEMRFFPGSIGFGIGTGFHGTESKSSISSPYWIDEIEYSTMLYVVPVVATLYYVSPVNEFSFLTFGAGLGYYYGMFDGAMSSSHPIPDDVESFEPIGDGSTIGYHVKAEYSIFFKPFCLTAGVMGRYVEFSEFKDSEYGKLKIDAGLTGVNIYLAAGIAI
jgi:hypothetical protein